MREYEVEVFEQFKKYANVAESYALYDSVLICGQYYGAETTAGGWFNSFLTFGQQEQHSFFKIRTEGTAGPAYCNMQSADSMDFAFICDSIGIAIQAPAPNRQGEPAQPEGTPGDLYRADDLISHWFQADLPNHSAIQLKIQQDIRVEINCMHCPPGYGAIGAGAASPMRDAISFGDIPFMTHSVVQGVPILANRYPLPEPIGIPRTATIEGIFHVSEYARELIQNVRGPQQIIMNSADGLPPYTYFPSRYVIQLSLFGQRLVQQRGQYHR